MAGGRALLSHGTPSAMRVARTMNERLENFWAGKVNTPKTDPHDVPLQVGPER